VTHLPDERLVAAILGGDEGAFVVLVGRHQGALARLIRHQVGDGDDAEDVMQETLLAAWTGLPQLHDPARVRAWLLQVARNRCRDFLKASRRQDEPIEDGVLEVLVDRAGRKLSADTRRCVAASEALGGLSGPSGDAARLFYLGGLSIAEIASARSCPEGTVKRHLHNARARVREVLGVSKAGKRPMTPQAPQPKLPPFPALRPKTIIAETDARPFAVECPELRWWAIVPQLGQTARWANYSPPGWQMDEYTDMRVIGEAKVHGTSCMDIQVTNWQPEGGWEGHGVRRMFGRLTEDRAQYLALIYQGETTSLQTYLDEGFDWAWGEMPRRLEDTGRFVREPDGSWRQAHSVGDCSAFGAGVCEVRVGDRTFECLRVYQIEGPLEDDHTAIIEGYFTRDGRNVVNRHHCHPGARKEPLDESTELIVDGVRFVLWYDGITGLAVT